MPGQGRRALRETSAAAFDSAATTLREFASALAGKRFDVLISDTGLPETDGLELMRRIRSLERAGGESAHTPAIALTASAYPEDRTTLTAGFDRHLSKPIEAAALVKTVADSVGRSFPKQ